MKAEARVLELADLAEQLRRRLKERQAHDGEMTLRANRAEKRCLQLEVVITGSRPAVRGDGRRRGGAQWR